MCLLRLRTMPGEGWMTAKMQLQELSSLQILPRIQDDLRERNIGPENSQIGSSSCQCSAISIGQEKEMMEFVFRILKKVKTYAKKFSQGHRTFLGLGDEQTWFGKAKYPPEGKWESVASQMVQRF